MPEVIVLGLGSMGSAAAYTLAVRGADVVGVDRFTPPHDRGAHAGGTRIIRMTYAEGAAYVPLLRRTYALWRDVEAASGRKLVTPTGGLNLGRPDSATVSGALTSAREHGLAYELLDAEAVRRRFPQFDPADDEVAVLDTAAGFLTPETAISTILELAERSGAKLRFGTVAVSYRETRAGVSVSLADGDELHADRLVIAPGGWAPGLLAGLPLRVERRVQHFWQPGPGFTPAEFPAWIWEAGGLTAYGVPEHQGQVKAAFHATPRPEVVEADAGAAPPRPDEEQPVRTWLRPRIPTLADAAYLGGKQCLYTLTPDENFVIGPFSERVVVAAGFSGHGFKFVPVVGEILADLATGAVPPYDLALFSPTRFG
ncbi:MAG: N-methyl-L-tryptophan oxidase [Hamadaea sp.]|uniref:N-methyl-L-tryptophan oxidase n=1 Tax=Hamadaea sp. TaxID=2024425 RepID=UPI001855A4C5|nr:N-methyl-L-tryptophan oxidase [Hamadaea sp.]NUR72585.1 N-methyl-L-tryptophan oxidase [Hamadaea sp.]NUT22206.1 N-methyl-L-tryptophan oxidase [Hamadaea sp.]